MGRPEVSHEIHNQACGEGAEGDGDTIDVKVEMPGSMIWEPRIRLVMRSENSLWN